MNQRRRRGGKWVPEDRLIVTLWGAGFLVPLSVLGCGLVTRYVDGKVGLAINLVSLFVNGLGVKYRRGNLHGSMILNQLKSQVDIVLSPAAAYMVDTMHSRSAETMAANK